MMKNNYNYNQKIAEQPYYMVFSHELWDVNTHETALTGETVTIIKMPYAIVAYHQLKQTLKKLEVQLWNKEGEEE